MTVRVVAFARLRELLGRASLSLELPDGAHAGAVWERLAPEYPALRELAGSTRLACNGRLVEPGATLHDGDELALLPPVGGG